MAVDSSSNSALPTCAFCNEVLSSTHAADCKAFSAADPKAKKMGPWEAKERRRYKELAVRLGADWDTPPAVLARMEATDCQHAAAMKAVQEFARFWRVAMWLSLPFSLLLLYCWSAWGLLMPVGCWLMYKPSHLNAADDLKKRRLQ